MVLYGTGVRRTELSLLKVGDNRQQTHGDIRPGKGSRERDVPLSPKLLEALHEYWRWEETTALFISKYRGPSWCGSADVGQGRLVGRTEVSPLLQYVFLICFAAVVLLGATETEMTAESFSSERVSQVMERECSGTREMPEKESESSRWTTDSRFS